MDSWLFPTRARRLRTHGEARRSTKSAAPAALFVSDDRRMFADNAGNISSNNLTLHQPLELLLFLVAPGVAAAIARLVALELTWVSPLR